MSASQTNSKRRDLRLILINCAVTVSLLIVGTLIARAGSGGATTDKLTFAGTLRQNGMGVAGMQPLTFTFTNKVTMAQCKPPTVTVNVDASGAFTAPLDIGGCKGFFDGSDIQYTVQAVNQTFGPTDVAPVPYAKYADRVGSPECPAGYTRDANQMGIVDCKKGNDEIVRVGTGNGAWWVDRYEASVWANADGTGQQYGLADGDMHTAGFSRNGQWSTPLFAVSKAAVAPAGYINWFQAAEACALSGKRLATSEEWMKAARGTIDPGVNAGANGACVTNANKARATGAGTNCQSAWGAQDMIGNVWEITAEWFVANGANAAANPWPAEYNGDQTGGVLGAAFIETGNNVNTIQFVAGLPSIAIRGGARDVGNSAGLFAFNILNSPGAWGGDNFGFRCVTPR